MAISAALRDVAWRAFMRVGIAGDLSSFLKSDLRAAVDAVDDWCDTNATSYNTALPVAFRTNATASQKALLLAYVCILRAGRPLVDGQ